MEEIIIPQRSLLSFLKKSPEIIKCAFALALSRTIWRKETQKQCFNGEYYISLKLSSGQEVLRLLGGYELAPMHVFDELLKKSKTIIDIGSREGLYCLRAAYVLKDKPDTRIIAIDADPRGESMLKTSMELSNVHNIEFYNLAVGNKLGDIEVYLTSKDPQDVSVNLYQQKEFANTSKLRVRKDTFDNIVSGLKLDTVDILKVDVDGAEREILEGMNKTTVNNLIIEIDKHLLPGGMDDINWIWNFLKGRWKYIYYLPLYSLRIKPILSLQDLNLEKSMMLFATNNQLK